MAMPSACSSSLAQSLAVLSNRMDYQMDGQQNCETSRQFENEEVSLKLIAPTCTPLQRLGIRRALNPSLRITARRVRRRYDCDCLLVLI